MLGKILSDLLARANGSLSAHLLPALPLPHQSQGRCPVTAVGALLSMALPFLWASPAQCLATELHIHPALSPGIPRPGDEQHWDMLSAAGPWGLRYLPASLLRGMQPEHGLGASTRVLFLPSALANKRHHVTARTLLGSSILGDPRQRRRARGE